MKALFQELSVKKIGWDDELNKGQKKRWDNWVEDPEKSRLLPSTGVCITIFMRMSCSLICMALVMQATWSTVQWPTLFMKTKHVYENYDQQN